MSEWDEMMMVVAERAAPRQVALDDQNRVERRTRSPTATWGVGSLDCTDRK